MNGIGSRAKVWVVAGLVALAGCATVDDGRQVGDRQAMNAFALYKKQVAQQIQRNSAHTFNGTLPPMLKSVVVLDITVAADGELRRVAVRRSNGFRQLERRAMDSVRRAGKLPAPTASLLQGRSQVSYLETWLFRADGRFQLRSLVTEPQPGADALVVRR